MRLDFRSQFLKMLNDGTVNGLAQIGMLVSNDAGLVPNSVENFLDHSSETKTTITQLTLIFHLRTPFTQKLVTRLEWSLDDHTQLGQLSCRVTLNVSNALSKHTTRHC